MRAEYCGNRVKDKVEVEVRKAERKDYGIVRKVLQQRL